MNGAGEQQGELQRVWKDRPLVKCRQALFLQSTERHKGESDVVEIGQEPRVT